MFWVCYVRIKIFLEKINRIEVVFSIWIWERVVLKVWWRFNIVFISYDGKIRFCYNSKLESSCLNSLIIFAYFLKMLFRVSLKITKKFIIMYLRYLIRFFLNFPQNMHITSSQFPIRINILKWYSHVPYTKWKIDKLKIV